MMMSTNYFQFWEANFAKDQRGPTGTISKHLQWLSKSYLSNYLQWMPKSQLLITGPTLGPIPEA